MRRVFADTYYWIALLNDKDQGHAAAQAASQSRSGKPRSSLRRNTTVRL
jgi:predicted nucleic acid-binding protein